MSLAALEAPLTGGFPPSPVVFDLPMRERPRLIFKVTDEEGHSRTFVLAEDALRWTIGKTVVGVEVIAG